MIPTPIDTPPTQPAHGGGHPVCGCPRGGGQARCYAFPRRNAIVASDAIITCIVSVFHRDVAMLFDPSSTYSFMSSYLASCMDMLCGYLDALMHVSTSIGDSIMVDRVYRSCVITICGFETRVDFSIVRYSGFWLNRWLRRDVLAFVRDVSADTPIVESISVVREFSYVFPADLPSMPPDKDIDFSIDLAPGTQLISITPYRMSPDELKELKE
ncbi:uncharacterized protein [Nicotiana tomentosiformis]|uniref:uncharacterized protein n=1 Tax=Nicotiana tomentosiformis TaxID=4098 RepID=UPI00388C7B2D